MRIGCLHCSPEEEAGRATPRSAPRALYSALQLGPWGALGLGRLAARVGALAGLVVEELGALEALIEQPLLGHLLLTQRRLHRVRLGLGLRAQLRLRVSRLVSRSGAGVRVAPAGIPSLRRCTASATGCPPGGVTAWWRRGGVTAWWGHPRSYAWGHAWGAAWWGHGMHTVHGARCTGAWGMMHGACGMVRGAWCVVRGAWGMVRGAWYVGRGARRARQPGVLVPDEEVDEDGDHLVGHAEHRVARGGHL